MPTFPFPSTANQAGTFAVWIHATDRSRNIFVEGETIVQQFVQWGTFEPPQGSGAPSRAVTGNWYLRDYYGNLIDSGALTAATSWTHAALPCGWYKLFLAQSGSDATMGKACGSATFIVKPADSRFPSLNGISPWPGDFFVPAETRVRGALVATMPRYVIQNSENYTSLLASMESALDLDVLWYLNPTYADNARPRVVDIAFAQGATNGSNACDTSAGRAGVTAVVNALAARYGGVDHFVFEGPRNESQASGSSIATALQTFSNTVKAAQPTAKVIGYCPVNVGSFSTAQLQAFATAAASLPAGTIDGFSFHFYNNINGDLTMGRKSMDGLVAILQAAGLGSLPLYQTEQGFRTKEEGVAMYHMGGQWDMLMLLLFDQYGLPKEHCSIFYDKATDESIPVEWMTQDQNLLPPAPMIGTFSREVWGKTFLAKLDFGDPGNNMMIGNRYHDAISGNDVVALMSAGILSGDVQFKVSGATSLVQVDCWGNMSTVPVTNGIVTVTVPLQPTYLRIPVTINVTLVDQWTTTKLAGSLSSVAAVKTSGSIGNQPNAARAVNGVHENCYFLNNSPQFFGRNSVNNPYIDDTGSYDAWIELDFPEPTRIDRTIVWCEPPWQSYGTLLYFYAQTWDGVEWVIQNSVVQPALFSTYDDPNAVVFQYIEDNWQTGCTVHSFLPWRWIFDLPFASIVTTTKLQLLIRNATYGQAPTVEAHNALTGDKSQFGNNFTIREIGTYCSDLAVERVVLV